MQPPRIEISRTSDGEPCKAAALSIDNEVCLALVTAGYRSREARAAVENARPHVGASATLEQVLREALRQCSAAAGCR